MLSDFVLDLYIVDILWGGNLSMMFYSSSHECYKSFEVTSRRRVTLKWLRSMNDLTSKTSYWDCRSHRICIVEKYKQAKNCQIHHINWGCYPKWRVKPNTRHFAKGHVISAKWRVLGFTHHFGWQPQFIWWISRQFSY